MARAQTYSSYSERLHLLAKFGVDEYQTKFLTENCSFLYNLLPGDLVIADRGFTIEGVWYHQAQINVPAFTKGKDQLDQIDVEKQEIWQMCKFLFNVSSVCFDRSTQSCKVHSQQII